MIQGILLQTAHYLYRYLYSILLKEYIEALVQDCSQFLLLRSSNPEYILLLLMKSRSY